MPNKHLDYPDIETDRVRLRILTLEHTENVFHHFSDPDVIKFMDIEPCKRREDAEEIITFHLEDSGCRWGIFDKESSQFMGTVGFHYIRKNNEAVIAEIGYDLAKRYWGKGYMLEVLKEVIAFGLTQFATIDATVEKENTRSIALLEKLGFTMEGETEDQLLYFYLNEVMY